MSEARKKLLGLCAVIVSVFLLMGGLYLPDSFAAESVRTALCILGVVLLIGGNLVMVIAHDEE